MALTNPLANLVDSPDDVLALFGGIVITIALISFVFLLPAVQEIAVGALIVWGGNIFNHFFQNKANATTVAVAEAAAKGE